MKNITDKQRAKINAALAIIHANGDDARAVQQHAKNLIAAGHGHQAAYEQAVGRAIKAQPSLGPVIANTAKLIGNSDSATVARYNEALGQYIATGDERHVAALEPMMRQDSVALAVKEGTITAEDAQAGRMDWDAIGFSPPEPGAAAAQPFAFTNAPAQPALGSEPPAAPVHRGSIRTSPNSPFSNQIGVSASPTGIRTGKAAERWARAVAEAPTIGRAAPLVRPSFAVQGGADADG